MRALSDTLDSIVRLDAHTRAGLAKLQLHTIVDLLYHFPTRYADAAEFKSIALLTEGELVTVSGVIKKIQSKKSFRTRVPMSEAVVADPSGTIRVLWFNQPYLARMYPEGTTVTLSGKATLQNKKLVLINPDINKQKLLSIDSHDSLFGSNQNEQLSPVYPETKGISSRWLQHTIARALAALPELADPLPEFLRTAYNLPTLRTALVWIHTPRSRDDALIARKRFSFEEIFILQLARLSEREQLKALHAYEISTNHAELERFINTFPFPLTSAQKKSIEHIVSDLEQHAPMSRLLEGDVGSGKTAVAAAASFITVHNRPLKRPEGAFGRPSQSDGLAERQTFGNLQVAYMAPTELLATQHFESFIEYFRGSGIAIALITGSGCRKFPTKVASSKTPWTTISRTQLSKWIA
ncbi:MAG TPA: DEAD/DEAH box helicase, partial [Candidatus Paceibacterota bacterium]|nr:DEAD/DEAH box helicase [Candidatus Paceibacterota bacterium]